jgi:hypothetical protein
MTKVWTCRRKLRSLKKYYKTFWQFQNLFCTKSQAMLFILSF